MNDQIYSCEDCKLYLSEACDNCSWNYQERSCTCFQGNAPCGYCENILYQDKD